MSIIRRKKKNKRKQREGVFFPPLIAVLLAMIAVFSICYLWLCSRCEYLGGQIKMLESKKTEIHNRVINEEYKWSNLKSPRNIETFMQRHNLVMTWPEESRIVRLRARKFDVSSIPTREDRNQYARRNEGAVND